MKLLQLILKIFNYFFPPKVKLQLIPAIETKSPIQGWSLDDSIGGTRFTWREALAQGNTGKFAIPTVEQENMIIAQAKALEPVWNLVGPFRITSWLRSIEHNASVGGAPHSAHLLGAATDFITVNMTVEEAKKLIFKSNVYPGGGEINTHGWVHIDLIHKKWFLA